jgi:hypothetical protein
VTEPEDHQRHLAHLSALADAPNEFAAIAVVLADPNTGAADSALITHIDRRAEELLATPEFDTWWRDMAATVRGRPFPVARIAEWLLYRNIALDRTWRPEHLRRASIWLQLRVATNLSSADALKILAEQGRTERVRTTAGRRR